MARLMCYNKIEDDSFTVGASEESIDIMISKRIRQEISALTLSLNFTRAQFFASHAHSQRVHSAAAGPLSTAFYTKEREG